MKSMVVEKSRNVPVIEEVDVVVVGGGTAGLPAAVAAARNGAKTALVERWGYVGGAAVGGLVVTVPRSAGIWGIEREFYDELNRMGALAVQNPEKGNAAVEIVSAPYSKYLGDQFLKRAGVIPFYHSWFADIIMREGRIDAVLVESKSGRQAIRATMVVDCTGDADVAARSGAPLAKGDDNGKMRGATTMYMLANCDLAKFRASGVDVRALPRKTSCCVPTEMNPGECNCWGGEVSGDGSDVRDLTRMEMELREQIVAESESSRSYLPGFERAFISIIAEQMGVRETRRIVADYTLTCDDTRAQRVFDDSIGMAYTFTLPYRSLIPKGIANLLVAGRCIGADHPTQNATRIVPNCFTTGQAAGTAAALAARGNGTSRGVDVKNLQAVLRGQGINLGRGS